MTWTNEQFSAFCVLLDDAWPGDLNERSLGSWRALLDPISPHIAMEGLRRLLHSGQRFRPSISEVLAICRDDPSVPTFEEAYQLVYGRGGVLRSAMCGDTPREVHPLVQSFAEYQGIGRLSQLPVDDPQWGEKTRRDLEGAWERHVEVYDGRSIAAIASGNRDGLRRLDPLSEVRPPQPALEEGAS